MYVPNYIPEPLEVPGNVTEQSYFVRLRFVRRVSLLHLGSLALIGLMQFLPWPDVGIPLPLLVLAFALVGLEVARIAMRRLAIEPKIAVAALPLVLVLCAWSARSLTAQHLPTWTLSAGPIAAIIYAAISGRDYSFVGCYLLSLISSTVGIAALSVVLRLSTPEAAWALGGNAAYLTYFVYDLASLQARRRLGEELAAVVDLYRDVFNIFGYVTRVIGHWKKHRIWASR